MNLLLKRRPRTPSAHPEVGELGAWSYETPHVNPALLAGFVHPSFADPLDIDAHLALVPPGAVCKGVVFESILDATAQETGARVNDKKYTAFRDYPMREVLLLKVQCARALYPNLPVREGLRRLGRHLFPKFAETLIGRVMYGVFEGNIAAILRVANKGFEITQNTGRIDTSVIDTHTVLLHFWDTYTFIDSYHLGVIEGTLQAYNVEGGVWCKLASPSQGELLVSWHSPEEPAS